MKKISREQKKIIYIAGIISVSLVLFWALIYAPQSRKLASIKNELKYVESQILEINNIMQGKELNEAVMGFNMQLQETVQLLLSEDEDVISNLSEQARRLNIEVKDITPSDKRMLDYQVAGYDIEELLISMNLSCEFRQLGEYMDILRNNFPALIRVRQLDIKGEGEGRPILGVALKISVYLSERR